MTREDAGRELRRLAGGLQPDIAGCARLLERISSSDHAEALRDALTELGARALLESAAVIRTGRVRAAVEKHLQRAGG